MTHLHPVELITYAAERLGSIRDQVTFLGGAVLALMVTEQGAKPPRPTKDVDVAIELTSRFGFYELEEALRAKGFQNAMEGPICRFKHGAIILDVMPTDPAILGFSNRWYLAAIRTSEQYVLENGITINLITPACFLATKMEAFDSPTREDHGDMVVSRDFEDIITLIDGRPTIAHDVLSAEPEVRVYLQERFSRQLNHPNWHDGVEAHVFDGRAEVVIERVADFVNSRSDIVNG